MYDVVLAVCLVKSLKNLQRLIIPEERSEETTKVIRDTTQEHPHINNVNIYYSRW